MAKDLDRPSLRRCQEHTEALVEELELGILWDEYGLVGDIVVIRISFVHRSFFFFSSFILWTSTTGVRTSLFIPVADTCIMQGSILRWTLSVA
jgi:hypothetical protein